MVRYSSPPGLAPVPHAYVHCLPSVSSVYFYHSIGLLILCIVPIGTYICLVLWPTRLRPPSRRCMQKSKTTKSNQNRQKVTWRTQFTSVPLFLLLLTSVINLKSVLDLGFRLRSISLQIALEALGLFFDENHNNFTVFLALRAVFRQPMYFS